MEKAHRCNWFLRKNLYFGANSTHRGLKFALQNNTETTLCAFLLSQESKSSNFIQTVNIDQPGKLLSY